MPSNETSITVDVREVSKEHFTISVQYKNMFWFRIGLWFIKVGCWITGITLVDEFPMSLYQTDKDVK